MVVDDDRDHREACVAVLRNTGHAVVEAANGLEALRLLESGAARPDLILLDLEQPVMDGRQFLCEQRRRPELATIPVALISAERDLAHLAAELDVEDYLSKPLTFDALVSLVDK